MTISTGSSTGSTPTIPFNQSTTFALNQVLMYDTTLNAFINTALPVGGTTGEINTGSNLGAGQGVFKDKLGAGMRFKSIVAGTGIAVTSDTDEVFIAATGTGTGDITGGVSTGSGNSVFRDKSGANLQFRSLTAGTNVTLVQNSNDIVVNAGTNALTLNSIADTGYVKVTNNLSDITAATARTNLAISSTVEADAKYLHLDTTKSPTVDATTSLGDGTHRFNNIYAVSFKGNADTATSATSMVGFTPGDYLIKAGGTMAGTLVLSGAPTANLHAATKLYVDASISDTISAAPGVLDTLNEIAAALGDDANFATTVTNSIATKLALAGGTLTGALTLDGNPASSLIAAPKQYVDAGDALQLTAASNLSDLANAATARTNLGLGTVATTAASAYLAAGTLTSGVAEGSNLYFTNARADARITAADTDDLSEGSTNFYHTVARAKAATILDAIVNGVTDVAPSQNAVFDALALKEGTLAAGTTAQYYRGDKSWQTLDSSIVTENTNLYHTSARADARIAAASISDLSNVHTAAATDGQVLKWDNGNSRWAPASHSTIIGANDVNDLHIDWGTGTNQVSTADIPESTNLFYTDGRADTRIALQVGANLDLSSKTTANLTEGANLYYTDVRADARIGAANINALANVHTAAPTDGQVLKWDNSNTRWAPAVDIDTVYSSFNSDFDTRLATKSTANLTEGANLYFTNARADARISSAVGTSVQAFDADLTAIAGLANTDSNFIVGNGSAWVAEDAATARASLGLGTMATALTSIYYTKTETDARFANVVGTGANLADLADASAARTNLGLGTAAVANTSAFADSLLSNLTNNATARTNLGTIGLPEGDARYVRLDVNYLPTADNTVVLGDTTKRFNTIYARQFKGQMSGSFDSSMTTNDLLEGASNLYFTNARADARITAALIDEDNMATDSATRLPSQQSVKAYVDAQAHYSSFNSDFDTRLATKTTANLTEGANLYYTDVRADARITNAGSANWNTAFGWGNHASGGYLTSVGVLSSHTDVHTAAPTDGQVLKWVNANSRWEPGSDTGHSTTSTLTEGTNLYYTDARADARVVAASIDALTDVTTTSLSPSNNQVLTWVTANSRWEPATVSGGGGGEANDGANVGTAGVGVYDGKSGATLQFRKLNSLDANLTIVDDSANNKIDFDLNDDVMLITENLAGVVPSTARTNIGLSDVDSPTFGGVGTGFINIDATPSAGPVAPTYSGIVFKSIPVPSGSGHKWLFGNEQDGDHSFSYYTINDAGANTSSGETYIMTRPTGTKFISLAGTGIRTYINGLFYPQADGTANQVLKTDGAGALGWTSAGGVGTVTSIIAGTGLTGGTITASGTIAVDVGTAANKIVQLDGSAKIPAVDGSLLTGIVTTNVAEGTNLYYTDVRADARITNAGSANWNTAFGWGNHASGGYLTSVGVLSSHTDVHNAAATDGQVLTWVNANSRWEPAAGSGGIALTDLSVGSEGSASGDGSIAYNNSTGVFTYTPPTASGIGAGTMSNVVEDTSPQLGGDLDAQTNEITNVGKLQLVDGLDDSVLEIDVGYARQSTWALTGSTSGTTPAEIFVGGTASRRVLPADYNDVAMFEISVVAVDTNTLANSAAWKFTGFGFNNAGTLALIGNITEEEINAQTGWSVVIGVTSTDLTITVTADAGSAVKWAAFAKCTQAQSS
jgi:hypothetical protein